MGRGVSGAVSRKPLPSALFEQRDELVGTDRSLSRKTVKFAGVSVWLTTQIVALSKRERNLACRSTPGRRMTRASS